MNIVYLSPHYPTQFSQFVERLAAHGVTVFGISDMAGEHLPHNVKESLAAHFQVPRLEDTAAVLAGCRHFRDTIGPLHRVESHLEPWLELEGCIRQEFDLFGPKPADLEFLKKKSQMKDIFTRADVPTARGVVIQDRKQAMAFIDGRFPVFIKPDIGVGADDTYTIRKEEDLDDFFAKKRDYTYFMEEHLSGVIESFDGLTDSEGNIVFFTSHVFSNDIHNVVKNKENLWYVSQRVIPTDIQEFGEKVVRAANLREKFFHIEFFRGSDGKLKGLELNMRPPGGLSTHMFNYACDIDVYDWWARIMAGARQHPAYERKYHCSYVGRRHDRQYVYTHDQLYEKWGDRVCHSQPMNPIEYMVMGHWGYLIRSPQLDEARQIINDIVAEA